MEPIKKFFEFVIERQEMWHRRFVLKQEYPFSEDTILANNKFTNVYRQLDKTSLWVHTNIIKPYNESNKTLLDKRNVLLNIVNFRWFNNYHIHYELGLLDHSTFDVNMYANGLVEYIKEKPLSNTSAYLTPSISGQTQIESNAILLTVLHSQIDLYIDRMSKIKNGGDLKDLIKTLPYLGNFMSYEIYCDLVETDLTSCNLDSVISKGPGSAKGMKLIFGNNNYLDNMKTLYNVQGEYLKDFKYNNYLEPKDGSLSYRVIEHSLCEYMKYVRLEENYTLNKTTSNTKYKKVPIVDIIVDGSGMGIIDKKERSLHTFNEGNKIDAMYPLHSPEVITYIKGLKIVNIRSEKYINQLKKLKTPTK